MDSENTSESDNSGEAVSVSSQTLEKVCCIPSEKYAYNADDSSIETKEEINNKNSILNDLNRINHTNSAFIKLKSTIEEQSDNSPNSVLLISAKPEELYRNLLVKNDLTDSHVNLEHSNGKFGESETEEERTLDPNELHHSLLLKIKSEDSECLDSTERLYDSSDSRSRLSNDSAVEEHTTEHLPSCNQSTRRTLRNSKRKRADGEECCPVCGVTVRLPELEGHYSKEVESLAKIPKSLKKPPRDEKGISTPFVQVKSNRENRLSAKVARYAAKDKSEIQCPVCHLRMTGSQREINRHVLNCINEEENSDELVVVDDNEDSFEEYEFADQTRVRAISFVPGGYKSLQGQSSRHEANDDDEDLDVDVDDTMTYGKPQYTEMDVIHTNLNVIESKELQQLRKAVLLDPTVQPQVLESRKWLSDRSEESKSSEQTSDDPVDSSVSIERKNTEQKENPEIEQSDHVVSSLKEKIRDLEEQNRCVKCLICLESYTKPVVSTTCWHVHCEECWLMTMGVKKLCPQCNMIVFPSDLRRIYL